jgi:hypothetical protein
MLGLSLPIFLVMAPFILLSLMILFSGNPK